jgi:hypothetical protein
MTGYETFGIFQALKLHFTQKSYDYFKYNGKSRVSVDSFENRKDKYYYYKLSRKYPDKDDFINLTVSNLLQKENLWVADLMQEEAEVNYREYLKVLQSLSYTFENDCRNIFEGVDDPNDVIKVVDGDYPILLRMCLQKDIEFVTLCVLAQILGFLPMWEKKIADTIRWPTVHQKITKFAAFLPKDIVKYKMILKKVIE